MTLLSANSVDVVPFAARAFWASPTEYEIWWEDPRDIFQLVVTPEEPGPDAAPVLEYWRRAWPKVRVAKGEIVGAGESGWLANDDWTNGSWQPADVDVQVQDGGWAFTFRPLNAAEFPNEKDFPAAFRRTLKLRLRFPGAGVQLRSMAAYTDSVWQEAKIVLAWKARSSTPEAWDGSLEVFNGQVLGVEALDAATAMAEGHQWRSSVQGEQASGIRTTIRYAHNDDRNSFDRTIVTLRSEAVGHGLRGVSFFLDDALGDTPMYLRDLGLVIHRAELAVQRAAFEQQWAETHSPTLYEQIHALTEQTWERAWAGQPRKTSRMYFVVGCEGSRQKFGIQPNGDVFLSENGLRWAPGRDTPRLSWDSKKEGRELHLCFGFPEGEPGDRSILDGYLPILHTAWLDGAVAYEQETYATWLWGMPEDGRREGDDPVIAMMQVRFTNRSDHSQTVLFPVKSRVQNQPCEKLVVEDGWISTSGGMLRMLFQSWSEGAFSSQENGLLYQVTLAPHATHTLVIKIPHLHLDVPEEREQMQALSYGEEKERVARFWRQRVAQGAAIETPNPTINNFYRTHLMHMLVVNDREPASDRNAARCGGFNYGSFPDEGCMAIVDLDRRGYHLEAERCLEAYVYHQGSVALPGNFQSKDGVFYGGGGYEMAGYNRNHGWVLWTLAEHYRFTRDQAWLERIAPALVKGCEWIIRERQATMQHGAIQYGFLPSGSLEDVTDYWTWLATNAYAGWGFRAAAWALGEIGHPEAARMQQEAEAFDRDLRAGFYESCARSPVVQLRDGTWVPHFPARLERRGRDFGWLREVLEGASHLIYCGFVDPNSTMARWILQDYEDNLFLSAGYGYQAEDFDRQWFDWGGFSMQSNLLLFPPLYLWRDEPKHYLRGYFNGFTSAFFPDTVTMCEHALPDLAHWRGDHFKSSDEANSNGWLRGIFVNEQDNALWIGQAIPREWLRHGARLRVERAATYFGPVSAEFLSETATGTITVRLEPPHRNPPERIHLRLRHPEQLPIQSVWVNGLPHPAFDPAQERITLESPLVPVEVRVQYEPSTNA